MYYNSVCEENKVDKKTIIGGLITVLLFTIYNIFPNSVILVLGILLLLFALLLFQNLQFFYLLILLSPNIMTIKIIGKPNAIIGYFALLFCLKLIIQYGLFFQKKVFAKLIVGNLFLFISILLNSEDKGFVIRIISFVVILTIIYRESEIDKISLMRTYIFGCVIDVICSLIYKTAKGINVFTQSFSGINDDRNYFAITGVIALALLTFLISYTKKLGVFEAISLIALSIGGILSNSRTFIILFAVVIIIFAFEFFSNPSVGIFLIIVVIVILIGQNSFLANIFGSFDNLINRFNEDNAEGGNGRFEAWNVYLNYLFSSIRNILLGCGSSTKYATTNALGISEVEHNTIVQLLFSVGIIGTIGYITMFSSIVDIIKNNEKMNCSIIKLIPLIVLIIGYCTINGAFSDRFIYSLYMCICVFTFPKYCS